MEASALCLLDDLLSLGELTIQISTISEQIMDEMKIKTRND